MTALSELRTLLQDDSNMSAYLLNSSGLILCFLNLATRTKLPRRQYVNEDRQAPHGLTVRYPQVSDDPHHPGPHQEGISGSRRQTRTPPHRFGISGFEMYGKGKHNLLLEDAPGDRRCQVTPNKISGKLGNKVSRFSESMNLY